MNATQGQATEIERIDALVRGIEHVQERLTRDLQASIDASKELLERSSEQATSVKGAGQTPCRTCNEWHIVK